MNVRSFREEKVARIPDKTFLVFQGQTFTFKAFDRLVNRVANSLSELGVGKGDRVGGFMPNCLEWLVLYFAVAKPGAANVFVNTQYNNVLLQHAFTSTDLKAVMVSRSRLPVYEKIRENFSALSRRILVDDLSREHPVSPGMIDYRELLNDRAAGVTAGISRPSYVAEMDFYAPRWCSPPPGRHLLFIDCHGSMPPGRVDPARARQEEPITLAREIRSDFDRQIDWIQKLIYPTILPLAQLNLTGPHRPGFHVPKVHGLYRAGDATYLTGSGIGSATKSALKCVEEIENRING